jgi:hypothetical protein
MESVTLASRQGVRGLIFSWPAGTFHIMSVPQAGANKQDVFLINPGLVYDKFRYPPYLPFIYRAVEVYCDRCRGNREKYPRSASYPLLPNSSL